MPIGGKRKGAGRPTGSTKKNNKIKVSFRLKPEIVKWLKKQHNQSRTVETALTEHKEKLTSHG